MLVLGSGRFKSSMSFGINLILFIGEKVVPIPQESLIASSPAVQSAVMFGRGKNQCGILVEPSPKHVIAPEDVQGLIRFRNMIW